MSEQEFFSGMEPDAAHRLSRIEELKDKEEKCPTCPGDGTHEPTVFWDEDVDQFRCTCCGWVHTELTNEVRTFHDT